jgi:hypothetical protein
MGIFFRIMCKKNHDCRSLFDRDIKFQSIYFKIEQNSSEIYNREKNGGYCTCLQNLIYLQEVQNMEKKYFLQIRILEIHKQRLFFDNKENILKIVVLKIQMESTCIGASSTHKIFIS